MDWILSRIVAPLVVMLIVWLAGSTVWIIKEVLRQRTELTMFKLKTETEIASIQGNCKRHQTWSEDMQGSIGRMDRNIVSLCAKNGVNYEEPKK